MIFLNGDEVKITGGDYLKNFIEVMKVRSKNEFPVSKEQLTADGGYLEIYHAVRAANKAHTLETGVSREEFHAYEKVRKSGVTNMWHVSRVSQLSSISKDKIEMIMAKYDELKKRYIRDI